ncbi:hypothetical protein [Streptomyces sp. ODS28]|uniref:hypothetical protein n=1 Tax=Streptomyces sp. ODS28 TaxID=3136688 RepID=UPI0031E5B8F2
MSSSRNPQSSAAQHPQSAARPFGRIRKPLVAAVGLGLALTLSACNGNGGGSDKDAGAAKSPAADASKTASPKLPEGDKPMVAGWQAQTSEKHHFRYDVPGKAKQWKLFPEPVALSYSDDSGKPIVVMTSASHYREGGCKSTPNPKAVGKASKGQLATVGTTGGLKDGSLQENARNWAGNWGFVAYGGEDNKPKIKVSKPKPWSKNGIHGYTATAHVTVTNRPSKCVPPKAVVHSIAQKLPDGTMHGWVAYGDQGVPNALKEADFQKIMNTVRPTDG